MTGHTGINTLLILIIAAATVWYINSIKYELNQLIYRLKKKNYTLYIYHEGTKQFEVHTVYRERSMRNAITEHFLSYGGNATLSRFKTHRDYNDYAMYYDLNVDGDTYNFKMIKEVDGLEDE